MFFTKNPKNTFFTFFQWKIVFTIDDYRATAFVAKKTSFVQRKSEVFNVGVSSVAKSPRGKIPLGKNPVTIDDYRATAFV